jgi:hypothetical protein
MRFENAQVGDEVIWWPSRSGSLPEIKKIAKTTKTRIELEDGTQYTRSLGKKVGSGSWHYESIDVCTPENMKRMNDFVMEHKTGIETRRLRYSIEKKLQTLSITTLRHIAQIIEEEA